MLDRPGPATSCARTGNFGCLRERGSRPRGVDLLGGRLGRGPEGCVVGDAVPVPVGGDHACGLAPGCGSTSVVGRRSKSLRPRRPLGQGVVEYCVSARLDQFLSLVESRSHLNVDDAVRRWDEAGDEARWFASPARACGTGGGPLDAVVEDGGDVVRVTKPARGHEARLEGIDIVMVRFSASELSRERAERLGLDGLLRLFVGEPGATDEDGPTVVLG